MRTREYDLNVYVVDGVARLSAYEYTYSDSDDPQPNGTNTSKFTTLEIPMDKEHADEVAFLLSDEEWQAESVDAWQEYDSPWENMAWLDTAPESIKAWGQALAEYEPETQHEWELFTFDLKYGEHRDVACLNCDATYPMYRLSWDELVAVRP
jgi:hypothetical protein